jgi:site-specific recombinase XerC
LNSKAQQTASTKESSIQRINAFIAFMQNSGKSIEETNELDHRTSAHTLRHCFAAPCLEKGIELVFIREMLGHKNIKSTCIYLHMTSKSLMGVKSPADAGIGDVYDQCSGYFLPALS